MSRRGWLLVAGVAVYLLAVGAAHVWWPASMPVRTVEAPDPECHSSTADESGEALVSTGSVGSNTDSEGVS